MAEAYTSPRKRPARRDVEAVPGTPASARELRAQGRKTMRKLLDAGMRVFAERGYQAARVDDIVRVARTSHGTFYLYFANKEELVRTLAVECAHDMDALASEMGPIGPDADGAAELRRMLGEFFSTYRRYGPVIRAWMEGDVDDRETNALGVRAFTNIATAFAAQIARAGGNDAQIPALMAMIERFAYFLVSRRLDIDSDAVLDSMTRVVHRGFFGAPLPA
jgi:AcrR family transcriptional regulator